MKVGIITATRRHLDYKNETAVRDYYSVSPLFRYALAYCEKNYDETLVLSFGYPYVLTPEDGVTDVDPQVDQLSKADKKKWVRSISEQIVERLDSKQSSLFLHTPNTYKVLNTWLEKFYPHVKLIRPMSGKAIGEQLAFYKADVGQLPSVKNEGSI